MKRQGTHVHDFLSLRQAAHECVRHAGAIALVLLAIVSLFAAEGCKRTKESQKEQSKVGVVDTSQDTTKGFFAEKYDSLSNKVTSTVSNIFNNVKSIFSKDTTKGTPVLTAPPIEQTQIVNGPPPNEPGFLQPQVKRKVEFDSNGNVIVRDVFLGGDVRTPQTYTFDDYLRQSSDNAITQGYEQMLHKQLDTGKSVDAQTGLLGDYGNISIPIPPSVVPTIFGRPSINLRVNGDVAIHLAYRDQQTYATTGSQFFGSETGLDFKQEINVSTNGTIGDKLKIGADWGSDRMFQFDNLLKFNYVGYPEELIQTFDAGNVTFNTPSKYIGLQQDLFGLKAVSRFGPVYVTTMAAQKKGERQSKTFGGGGAGQAVEHIIRPWEYRRNRFFLDTSYIKYYEPYCSTIPRDHNVVVNTGGEYLPEGLKGNEIQVWTMTQNATAELRTQAVAWYNLPIQPTNGYGSEYRTEPKTQHTQDTVQSGYWLKMDSTRYSYDPYTGILILNQEPEDQQTALAVSYPVYKNNSPAGRYGEQLLQGSVLVLKLLKPVGTFKDPSKVAWRNIVKNSYYVGGQSFTEKDFALRIMYQTPRGGQQEFMKTAAKGGLKKEMKSISILGLDRYQNSNPGDASPDGLTDFGSQFTIDDFILDARTGTLVFPYLEPFGQRVRTFDSVQTRLSPKPIFDSNFYLPEVYTKPQEVLRNTETKQVSINVRFAGGVSATLNLNAYNLVEGSVKVSVGATQLVEGTDFRVDYNSGTVTILKPDLVTAGQISVEYDQHDIFTNATKNVLGFRAEVPIVDAMGVSKGTIGTTFMNYSMHLPTLKTRQGEEPLSNWIWGFDGGYKFELPQLTDALNVLPMFNLKDKSELSVKADAALSIPNPNTQKSPMDVDNGASIAYLDDFEGGMNQFPLYLNYGRWHPSSQPADSGFFPEFQVNPDTAYWRNEINRRKGRMMWWVPTQLPDIRDIKPNKSVTPGATAQVMDVDFDPNRAGVYNPNAAAVPPTERWGGLIQYAAGLNVAATNTDAVQMWIKIEDIKPEDIANATLRLDLGRISEDVIPNGRLENEDQNNNGSYDDNLNEDLGLDGMDDTRERAFFDSLNIVPSDPSDPNNDDYTSDITKFAGQEGNHTDANYGRKPDNEDLDGNGTVGLDNEYYEYEIPLNLQQNKYVIGNTNNTWFQLRIPLGDFNRIVGTNDTSFSNISYYRLWINGVQKEVRFQLYDLALVGSQWTRGTVGLSTTNPIGDSSLRINFVDFEENGGDPTYYTGPPNVQRDIIPGQTTTLLANEQSINLQLRNVACGQRRQAERIFPAPNDLFNYRAMAIWVHGDTTPESKISNRPLAAMSDTVNRVWVYMRFGTDQFNYYEYRRPLVRGWQNIHVDFGRLTAMKAGRKPSADTASDAVGDGVFGSLYSVVGSPTLTNAQYFVLGVDQEDYTQPLCQLSTDVWWDELRLLDANDKMDYAYTGAAELKLAEFGRIMAGMTNERPDFHRVDERFNYGRSLNLLWNVTGEFATEKMFPKTWTDKGAKLPITVSHSETVLRPKYIVNTDIEIDPTVLALRARGDNLTADSLLLNNETMQVKNSFGASDIALRFPGSFFLLPAFVNRLNFGFGYAESFLRSPQYEFNRAWSWTASARYSLPPLPQWSVSPFSWLLNGTTLFVGPYSQWKISPFPSTVSFGISATRGREHSLNRLSTLSFPEDADTAEIQDILNSRVPLINRVFSATRNMQINWKPFEGGLLSPGFDYSLDVTSNLVPLETRSTFNRLAGIDSLGNPIYNYDSAYYFQRTWSEITHDIFLKDGQLARLGQDYNADQKLHMTTSPRLPGLFGVEKIFRPVFDYRVDYRWLNSQTGFQNAKQGAWNNTITTGIELNVRELGTLIFGKPVEDETAAPQDARGRRGRGELGVVPEQMRDRSGEERDSPPGYPRQQPRNPVERGEEMRIQSPGNPLGNKAHLLDTIHRTPENITRTDTVGKIHSRGIGTEGEKGGEFALDTVLTPEAPAPDVPEYAETKPSITVKGLLQALVQKPLFDWNGTRFNFTQTNISLNNALAGNGSGITNFLARGIFTPEDDMNGPSRAYQLGLITDPSGRLLFHWNNKFPFVSFSVRHGLRQDDPFGGSVNVTDAFTQTNNFELSTSRPLWSGASINLNWKLSFGYDERDALLVDAFGNPNLQYQIKSGDVSRTFLSIPPLPFVGEGVLQSGIERVAQKYREGVEAQGITNIDSAHLLLKPEVHNKIERDAFMTGFETLPMFSSVLREFLPRLNYSFSWSGLEKSFFWFADHASVRNAYNGTYKRIFRQDPGDTLNLTSLQTVIYGFRPLIAFDISWDKIWNGSLTASLNYDTQTEWAADYASTRITKRLSTTFGINAHYNRAGGLSIPFLKLNLKNQFGAQFMFSQTVSEDNYYNFWTIEANPAGTSNGGLTKTTLEPRVSYTISNQVQIEGFYRYERTTPAAGALTAPPTRLIMAGIDMRLKIM